jgi:thiamine-phosphate pyrophosphorylase
MNDQFFKLTLITNKSNTPLKEYFDLISTCVKSGVTVVQLREKSMGHDELIEFGKELHKLLKQLRVPLIVNDHLHVCLKLNAEGLHLGQTDGDVREARSLLGPNKIIGQSINTLKQLEIANTLPLDYVGVGAIFPTQSKSDVETIWGLDGLKQAAGISKHPIIALGGIDDGNAASVMGVGASGVASIASFHASCDPKNVTENLRNIVNMENSL